MEVAGNDVVFNAFGFTKAKISIHGSQVLSKENKARIEDLDGSVSAELTALHAGSFAVDSADGSRQARRTTQVQVRELMVKRGANNITASANAKLPLDFSRLDQVDGEAQAAVKIPILEEFGVQVMDQGARRKGGRHGESEVCGRESRWCRGPRRWRFCGRRLQDG
jgi:hypothetical protein